MSNREWPLYEVFIRTKSGLSHRHAGSVHAADDQMALDNARDTYSQISDRILIILPWIEQRTTAATDSACARRLLISSIRCSRNCG